MEVEKNVCQGLVTSPGFVFTVSHGLEEEDALGGILFCDSRPVISVRSTESSTVATMLKRGGKRMF
jgi:hypothetical protein